MSDKPQHHSNCQLLTVPTYGLCTCDFDQRMSAHIRNSFRKPSFYIRQGDRYICVIGEKPLTFLFALHEKATKLTRDQANKIGLSLHNMGEPWELVNILPYCPRNGLRECFSYRDCQDPTCLRIIENGE